MLKNLSLFLAAIAAIFTLNACSNDDTASSVVSSGTKAFDAAKHANEDAKSYVEVADVFLDTGSIDGSGKPYFFVFSTNGCVYCDRLKKTIREQADLKAEIKENFAPYYINMSYQKSHKVAFLGATISTQELAQKYAVRPTPTLIFVTPDGKTLFEYPGFMPKNQLLSVLKTLKDTALWSKSSDEINASVVAAASQN